MPTKNHTVCVVFIVLTSLLAKTHLVAQDTLEAIRLGTNGRISNTIIYKHPTQRIVSPDISYSAVDSIAPGSVSVQGTGNIHLSTSPFVNGGVQIDRGSPAYNTGTLSKLRGEDTLDLNYRPRVRCEKIDIGAYEYDVEVTEITQEPENKQVCEGSPLQLSVVAKGTNVTYQWQRNGVNISGQTSSTLRHDSASISRDTGTYRVIAIGECCNDTSASVYVGVDKRPYIIAMQDTTVYTGDSVSLHSLESSGTILWTHLDTTPVSDLLIRNITVNCSYLCFASNGVCAEASDMVNIYALARGEACKITTLPDTTICYGDPYQLMPDFTQTTSIITKWERVETVEEYTPLSLVYPDTLSRYVAYGRGETGDVCTSDTLTVRVTRIDFYAMEDIKICGGATISLLSYPPVGAEWRDEHGDFMGIGNQTVTPTPGRYSLYFVSLKQGVCTARDTVKVYANPPDLQVPFTDTTICTRESLLLTSNVEPHLIRWIVQSTRDTLDGESIIFPNTPETYTAWVFDTLCGDVYKSVQVNVQERPNFFITSPDIVCEFNTFNLEANVMASWWTDLDGNRVINPITVLDSVTYIGVLQDGACTVRDTVEVMMEPRPAFTAMPDDTIVLGNMVTLWSVPDTASWYELSTGQSVTQIVVPFSNTAYLAVLRTSVCEVRDTVFVTIIPGEPMTLSLSVDPDCSANESSIFMNLEGGRGPYSYLWNTGSDRRYLENVGPGIYSVTVTDANRDTITDSVEIFPLTPLKLTYNSILPGNEDCNNGNIRIEVTGGTPGYTYLWNNDQYYESSSENLFDVSAGIYTLTVTDSLGCEIIQEIVMPCLYKQVMATLYISPNGDGKNDYLKIKYIERYPRNEVIIINTYGEKVSTLKNYDNKDVVWDGRNNRGQRLPDGIYYYIVEAEGVESMPGWLLMKVSDADGQ